VKIPFEGFVPLFSPKEIFGNISPKGFGVGGTPLVFIEVAAQGADARYHKRYFLR
jgi:hypothetical protein